MERHWYFLVYLILGRSLNHICEVTRGLPALEKCSIFFMSIDILMVPPKRSPTGGSSNCISLCLTKNIWSLSLPWPVSAVGPYLATVMWRKSSQSTLDSAHGRKGPAAWNECESRFTISYLQTKAFQLLTSGIAMKMWGGG